MAKRTQLSKSVIRVGVVGVGRGRSSMSGAAPTGMKLVAICDTWEERLLDVGAQQGVTTFTNFDETLAYDPDVVVLANYFHEHAPMSIKAQMARRRRRLSLARVA